MSRSLRNTVLILFAAAILGGILWAWYARQNRYNWNEAPENRKAYSANYDQPYGALVLRRLVERSFPNRETRTLSQKISQSLPPSSNQPGSYLFIGGALHSDSADLCRLLQFVKSGNTALIISRGVPDALWDSLLNEPGLCPAVHRGEGRYDHAFGSSVAASLEQPEGVRSPEFFYLRGRDTLPTHWKVFDPHLFCEWSEPIAIGRLDGFYVNFAEFPFGKGRILMHTNPLFFSNFHLIRPEVRTYAEGVLSWLPEGDVYWDEFSRRNTLADDSGSPSRRNFDEFSPLAYILAEPALAWAWYLLVAGALLWVIFKGRRRQRITPILPRNENSSYAYISAIARLHFLYSDYRNLCFQTMRIFLLRVRERYGLTHTLHPQTHVWPHDPEFVKRLALTSEIPQQQIESLINLYNQCMREYANADRTTALYSAIEFFFKKAR
ncbi:MAG: DUF4350 domain-containing protein [Saprospiraceae bacterium]